MAEEWNCRIFTHREASGSFLIVQVCATYSSLVNRSDTIYLSAPGSGIFVRKHSYYYAFLLWCEIELQNKACTGVFFTLLFPQCICSLMLQFYLVIILDNFRYLSEGFFQLFLLPSGYNILMTLSLNRET